MWRAGRKQQANRLLVAFAEFFSSRSNHRLSHPNEKECLSILMSCSRTMCGSVGSVSAWLFRIRTSSAIAGKPQGFLAGLLRALCPDAIVDEKLVSLHDVYA